MDHARFDVCRFDLGRFDVYRTDWDRILKAFKNYWTLDVTRRELSLGDRDTTTGWYARDYTDHDIEGLLFDKSATPQLLSVGSYVRYDLTLFTADVVVEGDQIFTEFDSKYYEVKTATEKSTGDSFEYRDCQLSYLPLEGVSGGSYTASTVEDARYRTKVWLETYLTTANLPEYIICYSRPRYPLTRVFNDKQIDVVFSLGKPDSEPIIDAGTRAPCGYDEEVPIQILSVDKSNLEGETTVWQAETELRSVAKSNPLGSVRSLTRMIEFTEDLGSTRLYGVEYILNYTRDTT